MRQVILCADATARRSLGKMLATKMALYVATFLSHIVALGAPPAAAAGIFNDALIADAIHVMAESGRRLNSCTCKKSTGTPLKVYTVETV